MPLLLACNRSRLSQVKAIQSYSDIFFFPGLTGLDGLPGRDGEPGLLGRKGEQGDMGIPGKDGPLYILRGHRL